MRIEHFKYLLMVEQYQSINKAADALFISQPALSSAVKKFEEEVGFIIFNRTKHGAFVTEKGKKLLNDVKQIMKLIDNWQDLSDPIDDIYADIDVYAINTLSNSIMIDIILLLKNQYPNISIFFNSGSNKELFQELKNKKINFFLGLTTKDNLAFLDEYALQGEIIGHDRAMVYIASDNALAHKNFITIEDLNNLTYVGYPEASAYFPYPEFFSMFHPLHKLTFVHREQIMNIVSQNKGVSIFNKINAINDYYVTSGLVNVLPIKDFPLAANFFIAYPKAHRLSPTEKIVYDTIIEEFKKVQPFLDTE